MSQQLDFENSPALGIGIYTSSEIAKILRLPYQRVVAWIKQWDNKLAADYKTTYSWQLHGTRAVSFHTLVEFYIMMQLKEAGIRSKQIIDAHKELSEIYKTAFPFAHRTIVEGIQTDSKKVYFNTKDDGFIQLNFKKQYHLEIIKDFVFALDFGDNELADKYFPIGRSKEVVVDPNRKLGTPVLKRRNINPEIIYGYYKAGDPIKYISEIFELSEKEVKDSIEYCEAA